MYRRLRRPLVSNYLVIVFVSKRNITASVCLEGKECVSVRLPSHGAISVFFPVACALRSYLVSYTYEIDKQHLSTEKTPQIITNKSSSWLGIEPTVRVTNRYAARSAGNFDKNLKKIP